MPKHNQFYSIYLITAALLWGVNFHLAKFMLQESSFIESATWRYIFGVLPLLLINYTLIKNTGVKKLFSKGILLVGLIGLFGFNIFFFLGLQKTTAVNAALIVSLNPIITLFLSSVLLNTQLNKFQLLGSALSLFGVVYLLSRGNITQLSFNGFNMGDLMIIVSTCLFALHHVWVKQYRAEIPNQYFTTATNFICLSGFLCLAILSGEGISFNHNTNYWLAAFGIGSLGTALAYILWNEGIYKLGADKAGPFMNIVPLAAAIIGIFLGEPLLGFHFISSVLIIMGIAITRVKNSTNQ